MSTIKSYTIPVTGLTCIKQIGSNEAASKVQLSVIGVQNHVDALKLEKILIKVKGVLVVTVSHETQSALLKYLPSMICIVELVDAMRKAGFDIAKINDVDKKVEAIEANICGSELLRANQLLQAEINERKKAEEALHLSEEYFRNIFEYSTVGKSITGIDGTLKTNGAFRQILGYSEEELSALRWQDITHPEDVQKNQEGVISIILGEKPSIRLEKRYIHKDGHIVWADMSTVLQRDDQGNPQYFITTIQDITNRKLAEQKLQDSEEHLRKLNRTYALLSEINQTIMQAHKPQELFEMACDIAVKQGGFLMAWIGFINPETKQVDPVASSGKISDYLQKINIRVDDNVRSHGPTGIALLTGQHIVSNDIANDPKMTPWRADALQMGYCASASFPLSIAGETRGVLTLYASEPNFFNDNELKLLDEMAVNIAFAMEFAEEEDKRKNAEKEIKKLNETLEQRVIQRTEQLEAANKELEAFSYSVSHDLRAPLRHINGFINLFLEQRTSQLTDVELGYLNVVTNSVEEMGKLIDALLSFSRLTRVELKKTQIDTLRIIKQELQLFEEEIKNQAVEIKIDALPKTFGDFQLMSQVWTNLISNAIKYTGKKEKAIIEIGGHLENDEAIFFIKDNGAGFNMKYADKLFGVFQRLHKPRDFEGVGIGLANIHRIVIRHGGRCWAEGEINKGATFYFSLPNK